MRNTFDIVSSQKDCCCTTNANIERQGCQTRNEMQGQTALILAALRDRTPASSGGASA